MTFDRTKFLVSLTRALGEVGTGLENAIVQKIQAGIPPPLQPETIRRKRSSKPLIDTGQMLASITHRIEAKPDQVILRVGIFDEKIIEYAVTHEYGDPTRNIPERSFLRSTFDEEKEKLIKIISEDLSKLKLEVKI